MNSIGLIFTFLFAPAISFGQGEILTVKMRHADQTGVAPMACTGRADRWAPTYDRKNWVHVAEYNGVRKSEDSSVFTVDLGQLKHMDAMIIQAGCVGQRATEFNLKPSTPALFRYLTRI